MLIGCDTCGVKFERKPSELSPHNYCCKNCFTAARKSGAIGAERKTGENVPCDNCGKIVYVTKQLLKQYSKHFCDTKCSGEWSSRNRVGDKASNFKGKLREQACAVCGKVFETRVRSQKYCSKPCQNIGRQKKTIVICENCGEEFAKKSCDIYWCEHRRNKHHFCSKKCQFNFHRGQNHPQWIADRSQVKNEIRCLRYSAQMQEWRAAVFKRDDYTCQKCNQHGGYLQAHHIRKFADHEDLRFNINNGITLCKKCHKIVTWREAEFEQFFTEIVNKERIK